MQLLPISLQFFWFYLISFPSWIRIHILNANPDQEGKGMGIRIHSSDWDNQTKLNGNEILAHLLTMGTRQVAVTKILFISTLKITRLNCDAMIHSNNSCIRYFQKFTADKIFYSRKWEFMLHKCNSNTPRATCLKVQSKEIFYLCFFHHSNQPWQMINGFTNFLFR